jgi:hypothetical protein
MTEEETNKLQERKKLNHKEYERLREASKDYEYLLDGEKDILLKDLYYEHLLTQEEINFLEGKEESEYSNKLLEELKGYRNILETLASEKKCDITKKL